MASDNWLDIDDDKPGLPAVVEIPVDYAARVACLEDAWTRLTPNQKTFLSAWRDCRYNANAAGRRLGLSGKTKPNTLWMQNPDYALVMRIWRANAGAKALDKDRLLVRQDDIVEMLLTPKPVLHQGLPVSDPRRPGEILEEVEAGAASKANETLMKAAGLLKDKELDLSVGIIGPSLVIQVVQPDQTVIDVTPRGVPIALPEPADEGDWLGA